MKRLWPVLLAVCLSQGCRADPCENGDDTAEVTGRSECLRMRVFGQRDQPGTMVVWLHGDVSRGGPADYHFASAQALGQSMPEVLSVALVRPGYPDGSGKASSVARGEGGRSDHYTRVNLEEVGGAIQRLRERYRPARVIVVGHSGGAASAAVLLGMAPGVIDAAVLVSCPCDIPAWRQSRPVGRNAWPRSEDPIKWADRVPVEAQVVAISGERDDNTGPDLAKRYVDALRARGIDARQQRLPWKGHNDAFEAPEVVEAVRQLVKQQSPAPHQGRSSPFTATTSSAVTRPAACRSRNPPTTTS